MTYVTIYGIGVVAGFVDITKKDLIKRALRLAIVIFFTTA